MTVTSCSQLVANNKGGSLETRRNTVHHNTKTTSHTIASQNWALTWSLVHTIYEA